MKVKEAIPGQNSHVMILLGSYLHHVNPVVKILYAKNEVEMQAIYTQVSSLQQVDQYLSGWIMAFGDKRVMFIMMSNMGVALKNTPDDIEKLKQQNDVTRGRYLKDYNMHHRYEYNVVIHHVC
jgi:hypothetical protein